MPIDTSSYAPFVPGLPVFRKDSVVHNSKMRGFGLALARAARVPIVMTSGTRTPASQASALRTKLNLGDDVRALYSQKDLIDQVLGGDTSTAGMTATLESQIRQNRYLSRHMRGDAIDIRIAGLDASEMNRLRAAMVNSGVRHLFETTPAHLHVEAIPNSYAIQDPYVVAGGATAAALALLWWINS